MDEEKLYKKITLFKGLMYLAHSINWGHFLDQIVVLLALLFAAISLRGNL